MKWELRIQWVNQVVVILTLDLNPYCRIKQAIEFQRLQPLTLKLVEVKLKICQTLESSICKTLTNSDQHHLSRKIVLTLQSDKISFLRRLQHLGIVRQESRNRKLKLLARKLNFSNNQYARLASHFLEKNKQSIRLKYRMISKHSTYTKMICLALITLLSRRTLVRQTRCHFLKLSKIILLIVHFNSKKKSISKLIFSNHKR